MDSDQPHQCAGSTIRTLGNLDWPSNDRLGRWLEQRREILRAIGSSTKSDPNSYRLTHRYANDNSYSNTDSNR